MPNLRSLTILVAMVQGTNRCCGVLFIGSTGLGSKPMVPVQKTPVVSLLLVGFFVMLTDSRMHYIRIRTSASPHRRCCSVPRTRLLPSRRSHHTRWRTDSPSIARRNIFANISDFPRDPQLENELLLPMMPMTMRERLDRMAQHLFQMIFLLSDAPREPKGVTCQILLRAHPLQGFICSMMISGQYYDEKRFV
jgi:hypothetical protein